MEIEKLPDESIWPKILEVADNHQETVSIATIAVLLSIQKKINLASFSKVIASNDIKAVDAFLKNVTFNTTKLKWSLKSLLKDTVDTINSEYKTGIDFKSIGTNKFLDKYVADLIVKIDDNTKLMVKELVKNGWKQEIIPSKLAKTVKQVIPLDPRRAGSLEKYRQSLYKDKDLLRRFPNKTKLEAEINRLYQKKYQKLLYDRSVTITRTECINMANEGSRRMYEEMAKNNLYIRDNYCLIWIVTMDDLLCDSCRKMIGATCSFSGNFENKANSKSAQTIKQNGILRRPTLHPRCRCCIVCGPKTSRYQ